MSRSGKKFGNFAYKALASKGYRVYPIHPDATAINGVKCYSDYADLPEPVTGHSLSFRLLRRSLRSARLQLQAFVVCGYSKDQNRQRY